MSDYPRPNKELIKRAPNEVEYLGRTYYKDGTGRYSIGRIQLSRVIWENEVGPIPKGYQIHHIDRNPTNNNLSNLLCVPAKEHCEIHKEIQTKEEKDWCRNNLNKNALPEAVKWHKSDVGREWHRQHALKNRENGCYTHELICSNCGKHYIGEPYKNGGNHFCSGRCKTAFRRKSGVDDVPRICECCGKTFMANKRKGVKTCSKECRYKMVSKRVSATLLGKSRDTKPLF